MEDVTEGRFSWGVKDNIRLLDALGLGGFKVRSVEINLSSAGAVVKAEIYLRAEPEGGRLEALLREYKLVNSAEIAALDEADLKKLGLMRIPDKDHPASVPQPPHIIMDADAVQSQLGRRKID